MREMFPPKPRNPTLEERSWRPTSSNSLPKQCKHASNKHGFVLVLLDGLGHSLLLLFQLEGPCQFDEWHQFDEWPRRIWWIECNLMNGIWRMLQFDEWWTTFDDTDLNLMNDILAMSRCIKLLPMGSGVILGGNYNGESPNISKCTPKSGKRS